MNDNDKDFGSMATRAMEIVKQIEPLLAGAGPDIQGAVLADLLATWLAGHPAEMREDMLQLHLEAMQPLIELAVANKVRGR